MSDRIDKEKLHRIVAGAIRSTREAHPDNASDASLAKRITGQLWAELSNVAPEPPVSGGEA